MEGGRLCGVHHPKLPLVLTSPLSLKGSFIMNNNVLKFQISFTKENLAASNEHFSPIENKIFCLENFAMLSFEFKHYYTD